MSSINSGSKKPHIANFAEMFARYDAQNKIVDDLKGILGPSLLEDKSSAVQGKKSLGERITEGFGSLCTVVQNVARRVMLATTISVKLSGPKTEEKGKNERAFVASFRSSATVFANLKVKIKDWKFQKTSKAVMDKISDQQGVGATSATALKGPSTARKVAAWGAKKFANVANRVQLAVSTPFEVLKSALAIPKRISNAVRLTHLELKGEIEKIKGTSNSYKATAAKLYATSIFKAIGRIGKILAAPVMAAVTGLFLTVVGYNTLLKHTSTSTTVAARSVCKFLMNFIKSDQEAKQIKKLLKNTPEGKLQTQLDDIMKKFDRLTSGSISSSPKTSNASSAAKPADSSPKAAPNDMKEALLASEDLSPADVIPSDTSVIEADLDLLINKLNEALDALPVKQNTSLD